MKKRSLIFFVYCFCFLSTVQAQADKKQLLEFIQNATDSAYKKENVPGILAGIFYNNERHYFTAGLADTEKSLPFDSATLFEIGSITKTFTAYVLTAVLMEKQVNETDDIVKYLPDSVQQNQNLAGISFLSLLNHTSGLPRLPDNMKPANIRQPYEDYTLPELFSYLKNCTPKPNGKSNYSNLGAGLAGILAERISGKTYAALLDQYVFLPFKMVTPDNSILATTKKSTGYFAKDDKATYWNMNVLAPAGGLKCTGSEMLTYLQNMCFPLPVSKPVTDILITETVQLNPKIAIGRGWHIYKENDQPLFYWHNGGTYGFSTFCAFSKDKSKAVFVVINQFNKNAGCDALGVKIIKRLVGEK